MQLKYVGPKPIISHTGIEFDKNKEDKYVYLNIAIQLIKALSHDYYADKTYYYNANVPRFSDDELLTAIKRVCKDFDSLVDKKEHDIEDEIQHNIQRANESFTLKDADKEVLKNNIHIMHDYMVQRSINKSIYYCLINKLAELVKKDHIDHIVTPMFQSYLHVLHSVQGVLIEQKYPIDTKIEIFKKNGELLVKLQVINTK